MSGVLLEHFETLAQSQGGVAKLRELILQLAVTGKLVPQQPTLAPAVDLLGQIRIQRENLLKDKSAFAIDDLKPIEDDEVVFGIPKTWCWVRLGELAQKLGAGSTPLGGRSVYKESGIKFLRSQNVWNDGLYLDDVAYISEDVHKRMSGTTVRPQDILLNITGASIGRSALVPDDFDEANVSQHVAIVRLVDKNIRHFIHLVLTSPFIQETIMGVQVGISREGLSMARLKEFVVPLPPLEEQRRIVEKVDQLMRLCDQLEQSAQKSESARQQLLKALLASGDWERVLEHLPTLLQSPDDVGELRKGLLQLAVEGRLVEQDSREKPLMPSTTEGDFEIPNNWSWITLSNLCSVITDGDHLPPPKTDSGVPFLVIGNVRDGKLNFDGVRFVSKEYYDKIDETRKPRKGDVLYTVVGSFGIPVPVETNTEFCVQRHIAILKPLPIVNKQFIVHLLQSSLVFNQASEVATGIAQKTVTLGGLRKIRVPIPPFEEQKRIVAKVGQLMALCDRLEKALERSQGSLAAALSSAVAHIA